MPPCHHNKRQNVGLLSRSSHSVDSDRPTFIVYATRKFTALYSQLTHFKRYISRHSTLHFIIVH